MTEPHPPLPPPSTETRLVLVGPNGEYLRENGGHLMGVVLTDTPNADSAAPISLEVEQKCSMEHWHRVGRTQLPVYGGVWPAETTA